MKTITKTYIIKATVGKVWEDLINPSEIDHWGAGPAKMSDREDSDFSIWGGDIHGKNVEVKFGENLVQDWYAGDWKEASKAAFTLRKINDIETEIKLVHENVPDNEAAEIDDGWDSYYLGAIKDYLENT